MTYDQERFGLRLEQGFEPENALDIQMVGRFIHQQHVRLQHQRLRDCQTFLPSSGECRDRLVDTYKASEAEGLGHSAALLVGVQAFVEEDPGKRFLDCVGGGKRRFLRDIANADLAPHRTAAAIRLVEAGQYFKQRRFAGPVGTDQPDVIALTEPERQVGEERFHPVALADGLTTEQHGRWHGLNRFSNRVMNVQAG